MIKDPYTQQNGTLKNKLNISDYETLNNAEKDITFVKFLNVSETFKTKFDIDYVKSINKHIFDDIFDWAGEFRTVPVYKEEVVIPMLSLDYSDPKNITKELKECLENMNACDWNRLSLKDKSKEFTKYLSQIWKIHPFRDGNTRTTLTFGSQFAKEHGFPLDLASLINQLSRTYDENGKITQFSIRDKFVLACIPEEYSPEPEHLEHILYDSMVLGINKNIENLQNTLGNNSKDTTKILEDEKEK